MARLRRLRLWLAIAGGALVVVLVAALLIWRDDILEALLDPKLPYAVYKAPIAPDYAKESAWAHLPAVATLESGPADVFFVHPTTFDGGKDWNGPIGDRRSAALLERVMLPNYAAPFASVGRVFAPRYRQASLYTSLSLFDDAMEAREFAYGDVKAAFDYFRDHLSRNRPFILVGVEQGGTLAARLLRQEIAADPTVKERLVAAYLIETAVPADEYRPGSAVPACAAPDQAGCVVAWMSVRQGEIGRALRIFHRAVVWNGRDHLAPLAGRPVLCVNPLLGAASEAEAPAKLNLGAANATDLEWGARPGFMARQVGAKCVDGILRVTQPRSAFLRPSGGWAERLRVRGYNLFYADLEADAQRRLAAYRAAGPASTPRA
ncbi:MAG: DUF3089 domain-containing protein [Pseudomonadota bacterium]|nr:DUF3089 domain-containing protein [Pseudomonadota bacterium]